MFLATDVQYDDPHDRARAAGVFFRAWEDEDASVELMRTHHGLAPYEPGQFYKRELPCLLPLIEHAIRWLGVATVIVDGYVDLGDRPGFGRHLYDALGGRAAVIGVAKTRFADAPAIEVLRGGSALPLFVTAVGIDAGPAAASVARMHGAHRIPSLLKRADQLARRPTDPSAPAPR